MSPAPRPVIQPSRTQGAKGGDAHSRSSPGRDDVEVAVQEQAPGAVRPQPADDDRAAVVGAGADARRGVELDAGGERDALDREADALELGGEHVLGALLCAGHARLPHERVEEREGPFRAVVDSGVDGPLDVMVFRLGHFAESTTWWKRRGRSPGGPVHQRAVGTICCEPCTRTPPENMAAYQPRSIRLIDTTRPVSGAWTNRLEPT